jgi:hypothetical protein
MADLAPALLAVARERTVRQLISNPSGGPADKVVSHLLAMQAQDYAGAKWAVGLRGMSLTESAIEQALAGGKIVRSWPMRGTLHFVAAQDLRWLISLLAPRAIAKAATRRRQLEIDDAVLAKAVSILERELAGRRALTRAEIYDSFERNGIRTDNQRGIHLIGLAAQHGVICSGAQRGRQPVFSLVDEVIPPTPVLDREVALAELAVRYLGGHAPATADDLSWWSGLSLSDCRAAFALAGERVCAEKVAGPEYWRPSGVDVSKAVGGDAMLLPGFDEMLLGYRDRSASLDPAYRTRIVPGANGMFRPSVMTGGRIAGTWSRSLSRKGIAISVEWFPEISRGNRPDLTGAAQRYANYLDAAVSVA